ncbi:MAG TPA: hypothetical protein VFJ84_00570 [Candidatus Saccharimonadales bacterium]|nr:hypothetical protein [Candidatus Saccharimonadales bacterium]
MFPRQNTNPLNKIDGWAIGKGWFVRGSILVLFLILSARVISDPAFIIQRRDPVDLMDLGVHELGHLLFMFFGQFMHILGGSLFQCLFPLMWLGASLKRGWYFAACLCLCWAGINLMDVSVYAGDARTRQLPLVCLGNDYDQCHDWYQILSSLNHLGWDQAVAHTLKILGIASIAGGLGAGFGLIIRIIGVRPAVE